MAGTGQCEESVGLFDHPVYKKLSVINGQINKMTKDEMKEKLAELQLETRGHKDVLKKRLKGYFKRKYLSKSTVRSSAAKNQQCYDYYVVIDFEATCDDRSQSYPHEIIEFPAVLINAVDGTQVDEFHSYVRPSHNAHLTDFCMQLTNITQDQVDKAPDFREVLHDVELWMKAHKLGCGKKYALVTDGPWDMSRFLYLQCRASGIPFPKWACRWLNIRKAFCNAYGMPKANVLSMLEHLGLSFEGRQHCGMDDARNIGNILSHMIADGCNLYINEKLYNYKMLTTASTPTDHEPEVKVVHQENKADLSEDDDETNEVDVLTPAAVDLCQNGTELDSVQCSSGADQNTSEIESKTEQQDGLEYSLPRAIAVSEAGEVNSCTDLIQNLTVQ